MRLGVHLPPGSRYLPRSGRLNAMVLADPEVDGDEIFFNLGDQAPDFQQRLTFEAQLPLEGPAVDLVSRAWLNFDTPEEEGQTIPTVESIIRRQVSTHHERQPNLVLSANFDVMAADLSDAQKEIMDPIIGSINDNDVISCDC